MPLPSSSLPASELLILYSNSLLDNPKPHVVGIAWVVECVEQRARVDETDFLVNIEQASIAGSSTGKRRRSMVPKGLLDSPKKATPTANGSRASDGKGEASGSGRGGKGPIEVVSSREYLVFVIPVMLS